MPRTNNENLISGTQAERISVSLDAEQLVKDTTTQSLFVGDGSTLGGRAVDVRPVSDITGNYTLVRADEGKILRFNSASAITITIPTNANVAYPVGLTRIPFINLGAGIVSLVADTGVILTSIESNVDSKESGEIHKTGTNTWFLTKGGSGASQLTELTDVNITNLLNTQTLQYNTTSGKWENVSSTDANTTYDLAIPASTTNLRLTGSDGSTDNITLTGAGATSIARTSETEMTITSTNITYGVLIPTGTTSLRLLGSDASTDDISIVGGTNTTITRTSDSILTLASDDTTYSLGTSSAGSDATIDLTAGGSGSGTDSITLAAGSNITISETGDTITFAGTAGTITSVGITSGGGLSVSGSPITTNGSITLTNTGVLSNVSGTGISVSGATGNVIITNTDLGSSQNIFKTVAISGQDNIVADSNSDTLTLSEGSNITLTTNAGTDTITIAGTDTTYSAGTGLNLAGTTFSNTDLGSAQNIFKTVAVSGQSDIVADSNTDTLTFAAGSNVSLTTTAGSDTLTIASTDTNYSAGSGLDLAGTTFSVDVSDFMANGVDNRILTASGADSINAESGLTFNGSTLTVGGSVIISSDLTVNGTTTTINTQTLSVDDPMVVVGDNNSANSVDLGIIGKYVDTNTYYSGLLRDASAGKFRLFTTTQDLSSATTVDPTNGGYANADLIAGAIQQSGATNGIVYADSNGNLLGGRTIAEGVGIDITNGSAVSGNPTIALDLSELTTSTSNADGDFFVVVDTGNAQKKLTKANINISGFNNDSGFTTNTGTVSSVGLAGDSGSTAITTSGTFTIAGGTNVSTSLSGSTLTIDATDTNTIYSAGDGLDLSGTTFSTDLKSNGGLVIESTELAINLGASSITGTLAVSDGGTGATSAGSARTNLGLGSLATLSSIAFSNIAPAAIQLSSESFTDVDTTLMTSAAIQDKILSYGYTTNTGTTTASNTQTFTNKSGNISQWTNDSGYTTNVGDITAVVAGAGLSGGATSGSATLSIPNQGSVSAGAYTNSNITVDARGIITDISNGSSGSTPNNSTITLTAGTGLSGGGDFTTNQAGNETLTMNIDSTVATLTGTQTLTNKTLTSPTIATPSITGTLDESGDIDISSLYGRLNFKKDSNGNVNNDAIFFINASDQYAGGVKYFHADNSLRLMANQADQLFITDGAIYPPVDNDVDLGTSTNEFKNAYFDGTVKTDNLTVDSTASVAANISLGGGSYTSPSFTFIDDNDCGMGREDTNAIFLGTGGSPRLKIYSDGAVDLVDSKLKIGNSYGSDGQVLTSTGSGVAWETPASSGISWSTAVDSNIIPDTDNAYDIGSATNEFRHGYFDGTVNCDGLNIAGNVVAGNSHLYIIGGGSQESRANIFLPNNETNMKIQGSSTSNTDIILDTRYTSGTGQILLKTKGQTRFSVGASGEFKIGTAAGTSGQVLTSGGSGNIPTWTTPSSSSGTVISVSAGTGMTQSGTSTVNPTLNVIGGTGITANADDIEIDTSVVATLTGTQTLTNKTLTDPTIRLATAYSTTPALSFTGDTNTGITHNGGNGFSFIHGGSIKTTFASTGLKINSSTYKIHADGSDKLNIWGGSDGSAAVRINDNYDLPITDGSANQVIQTNGSGTLSFVDASSGGASSIGELSDATTYGSSNVGLGSGALDSLAESGGNHPLNNVGLGINAGTAITTGDNIVAIGYNALKTATTQNEATAIGYLAGEDLAGGAFGSTAIGVRSLSNFTTGWGNTGIGHDAMWSQNGAGTGSQNTSLGYQAMKGGVGSGVGITGSFNVSLGSHANSRLADGTANVAVGHQANNNISSGSYNIGIGMRANQFITTGNRNIAIGHEALNGFDTESDNIAIGYDALGGTIAGAEKNIAIGNYAADAITTANDLVAIGYNAAGSMTTGYNNNAQSVIIGNHAGELLTNGSNNVIIGHNAGKSMTTWSSGTLRNSYSVIIGNSAGASLINSGRNIAIGHQSLFFEQNTGYNTYVGQNAGYYQRGAEKNTGMGYGVMQGSIYLTGDENLGLGYQALYVLGSGANNIAIGCEAGNNITTGSNNVVIGKADVPSATGDSQLSISDGDGGTTWITGNSSGVVDFPNGLTSGGSAVGGATYNPLEFKNSGHSTSTSNTFLPAMPMQGTNSFQANNPFYHAQKIYMIPLWSASGGTLNRIKLHATSDLPVADTDDWKIAIYESGEDGFPKTLLTTPYQWTPTSAWGTTMVSIYATDGSSQITLDANKWYWLAYLGASSTNGDNVAIGVVGADRCTPLSYAGTINFNNTIYWNAASTSFPSTLTVNSSTNRFQASQLNYLPRVAYDYVVDGSTGNWA